MPDDINPPKLPLASAAQALLQAAPVLAIEESHAEYLRQRFAGRPVGRSGDEKRGPENVNRLPNAKTTGGYGYSVDAAGVAVVSIKGVITPEAYAWYDDAETISDWVVRDLAAMGTDQAVRAVLFVIDSPGGYVAGSFELADAIARLSAGKPTATMALGYCCSAAYLQAVQTGHITAFKTSIVGSIGTRSAVIDASALFAKFGVKMIPIDSGGMKSAGLIGTEITPEQIAYFRNTVMKLQEIFTAEVAKGRRLSIEQAQQLADGRVHVAGEALSIGLIDAVGTTDTAAAQLLQRTQSKHSAGAKPAQEQTTAEAGAATSPPAGADAENTAGADTPEKGAAMPQENQPAPGSSAEQAKPAGVAEIEQACPGASSDFILDCAKQSMTLAQAKDAFIGWQSAQIKARDEELAKAKTATTTTTTATTPTAPAAAATKPVGTKVVEEPAGAARSSAASGGEGAIDQFYTRRDQLVKDRGMTRAQAVSHIAAKEPELYAAFLEAKRDEKEA